MKTIAKLAFMLMLGGFLFMSSCTGSYYVTDRPVEPVYERPAAPYDGAVWIGGNWVWRGGSYTYVHGHWARPRPGRVWVRGTWEHSRRGYHWHRGHWR